MRTARAACVDRHRCEGGQELAHIHEALLLLLHLLLLLRLRCGRRAGCAAAPACQAVRMPATPGAKQAPCVASCAAAYVVSVWPGLMQCLAAAGVT